MLGKTPRRLLLTTAVAAGLLLGSAMAQAASPIDDSPVKPQGGIGNIDVVNDLVSGVMGGLLGELSPPTQ